MTSRLHFRHQFLLPTNPTSSRFPYLRFIISSLLPFATSSSSPSSSSSSSLAFIRPRMSAHHHSQAQSHAGPQISTIHLSGGESFEIVAAEGLSDSDFRNAIDSSLFKQWLKNMQSETGILANGSMSLRQVLIQGVDMFGRGVGFLKFKADVIDKETGKKVPGIVFSRGPAVAILILLESGDETFAVLTEQVRVPVGKYILELPAGMLDDDKGDIIGTAVREVEEETGICLNLADMVNLTAFLDPSTGCKVFPSPGGCDEELSIFLYRGHADPEVITALHGKETGLREHGELIKVFDSQVGSIGLWLATTWMGHGYIQLKEVQRFVAWSFLHWRFLWHGP
ncbi:nudix hydrolase 14, chloroplastic isoform X2 [Magnolia sinica]|uniref:nudix hydrolase 14, chloroplastic isoform X2 n=1 Tax=Magnolia sinica TaxID=86752 RepID=UPI00265B17E6|nr:nudix hydrolase 14, chloroplastic isoform X2 [Magnolia sinica]